MLRSWLSWLLLLTALPALAEPSEDLAERLRNAVRGHDPAAQVAAPEQSPVRGLYLTYIDGVSGYVSGDGRYFIVGDMLDLASRSNVTETQRQAKRRALLQKIGPDESILFGPAKARHTIIVFTDVDCPYCRKLHSELDQLQARAIAVRYMAFPRSGPGTKAWSTMAAVWCSKDRREALTRATTGEAVSAGSSSCSEAVIAKHYALGQQLGIPGTPMIVLSDGTSLGGYMPPDKLIAVLEEHAAGAEQ
jgi:thiol:disulfide interchange protein DsbC